MASEYGSMEAETTQAASEQVDFETFWDWIRPILRGLAHQSVQYHDAEDITSEYSLQVWLDFNDKRRVFQNMAQMRAYYVTTFKLRLIDQARARARRAHLLDEWSDAHEKIAAHTPHPTSRLRLEELGCKFPIRRTFQYWVDCGSLRETGRILGQSPATLSRYYSDIVKRFAISERFFYERGQVKLMSLKGKANDIKIVENQGCMFFYKANVLLATVVEGAEPKLLIADSDLANLDLVIDEYYKLKGVTPPKKETAMAKRKAIKLDEIKDFPPTLAAWQEECGGAGFCLGGSGMKVTRRFKPGHDAKLKAALRRVSSANAKKLASELGWSDKIKWN